VAWDNLLVSHPYYQTHLWYVPRKPDPVLAQIFFWVVGLLV
jgi:hypothetical protein